MALHPLFRPREFFAERVPLRLGPALGVVVLVAVASTAGGAALGALIAGNVDGTVTIDNPDRPSEAICDGPLNDSDSAVSERCRAPATVERQASALFWRAFQKQLPVAFVAPFLAWPVIAGALHLASNRADARGGVSQSLAVAAWGMLPSVFRVGAVVVGTAVILQDTTLASDPAVLTEQVRSIRDLSSGPMVLIALGEAVWQGYVWTWGLARAREIDLSSAGLAAGVVAVLGFVLDVVA